MKAEIAIIRDRKVYRVQAPPGTRIFDGDRAAQVDFDLVCVVGEMLLAKHVLDLAVKGERGFRLIGFEPFPDE